MKLFPAHCSRLLIMLLTMSGGIGSTELTATSENDRFFQLVKEGNTSAVRVALATNSRQAHAEEVDGMTALHWAVHFEDVDTVTALIDAGANPSAETRYGVTPLSLASLTGNTAILAGLLEAGADANETSREGQTVLMTAARSGTVTAVDTLINHGADVNAVETWRGQTALMWSAAEQHLQATKALLRHGANVTARSDGGFTSLLFAIRSGAIDVTDALLNGGANINEVDSDGHTGVVLAILNGHYELAAFLLDAGADPNISTPGGTALHHAVRWQRYEFTDFYRPPPRQTGTLDLEGLLVRLIAAGADVNAPLETRFPRAGTFDNNWGARPLIGATPLLIAARAGDASTMLFLVAHGANPFVSTEKGVTPLMLAAGMGFTFERSIGSESERLEAVELLWRLGANLEAVTDKGETAMHGAARSGTTSVVQFLAHHGAAVDIESDDGWTPLENADGTRSHFSDRPTTAALIQDLLDERAP